MKNTLDSLQSPEHHSALDGLRGWAALAVALYHTILFHGPELTAVMIQLPSQLSNVTDIAAWAVLNISNGSFAVTLFFILSGLVLAESLQRSALEPLVRLGVAFSIRRTIRLMPPLIAGVLFSFLVGHAMGWLGLGDDRIRSLSQLRDNLALTVFTVNGATWTIQVEMLAIPIMLAIFALQRVFGPVVVFLALVAAIHLVPYTAAFGERLSYLNDALLAFAVGMVLAQPRVRQIFATNHRLAPWLLLAAFLFSRPVLGWGSHAAIVTQILIGGALIGNLTVSESSLAHFLKGPASQFLGRISYSFYLLNVPMIWLCAALLAGIMPAGQPLLAGAALFVAVALTSVPLSMVAVKLIEEPCIRLGREVTRHIMGRSPARPSPGVASLAG